MVVVIDGKAVTGSAPLEILKSILSHESITSKRDTFIQETINVSDYSLFICQGEYSVIDFSDRLQLRWVGTSGATTCHTVIIHDEKAVALAHIDSPDKIHQTVENMTSSLGNTLSLYVAGGFLDEKNCSLPISSALLEYFCASTRHFNVQLWITMELNTKIGDKPQFSYPIVTDIAFNLVDRSLHKAYFIYRGPELELRNILYQESESYCNIYNKETGCIEIPYFDFEANPTYMRSSLATDEVILRYCSTSPHCEPEYFCQNMRNLFLFIATQDSGTVFGLDKKAIFYKMNSTGQWIKHKTVFAI